MALITAAVARALFLGLPATADTLLDALVARVDPLFARYCGYPARSAGGAPTLEDVAYTIYSGDPGCLVDPDDSRILYLSPYPVITLTAVYSDATEAFATAVSSSDYSQRGDHGEIVRLKQSSSLGAWASGEGHVKVSLTAGYVTIPEDLQQAAAEMVLHWYNLARGQRGRESESQAQQNVRFLPQSIPAHVKEMLAPFRLASVLV